jgi:EAL domain-containing protein (putative c-di-GMP-specific phosphodiesterase class I)
MTVLAEGVEEPPQVAHLIRASCTAMQGYYFSRPLPEDQFIARLCQ